ncbi:MAG: PH domain-containing protein [Actinomycetales bacterium]|nr:PH domain-containing protein [Actinomycetales bacterium]
MNGRRVYWSATARGAALAYLAFACWWLVAVLVDGSGEDLLGVAPWLLLVGVLVHAVLWRPVVIVDDDGVELRNVVRDVRVPWSELTEVETRYALTLVTRGGRFRSWAAAAPGRPGLLRRGTCPGADRGLHGSRGLSAEHELPDPRWTPGRQAGTAASRDLRADSGAAAFLIEQRWAAWRDAVGSRVPAPHEAGPRTAVPDDAVPDDAGSRDEEHRQPGPSRGCSGPEVRWARVVLVLGAGAVASVVVTRVLG